MSKRSDFKRVEKDYYPTIDDRAVKALIPFLADVEYYAEPCYGKGHLVDMMSRLTTVDCVSYSDIETGTNALEISVDELYGADAIITNPPWSRLILHQMIMHFKDLAPTYLLFDADWMHTKQAIPYLKYCTDIISVGRLIWIEGTKMTGKDSVAWYRFSSEVSTNINFHPRNYLLDGKV